MAKKNDFMDAAGRLRELLMDTSANFDAIQAEIDAQRDLLTTAADAIEVHRQWLSQLSMALQMNEIERKIKAPSQ